MSYYTTMTRDEFRNACRIYNLREDEVIYQLARYVADQGDYSLMISRNAIQIVGAPVLGITKAVTETCKQVEQIYVEAF